MVPWLRQVFVPDSVEIRNSVMGLPPTQHPEKGRKTARGVRQKTPPPGAELPAREGGAVRGSHPPPVVEPEPEPAPEPAPAPARSAAPTPDRLRSRKREQERTPKRPTEERPERVKTPPPPIEEPAPAPAPAPAPVVAAESDGDAEWATLAEQTMDHDFASRCLDEREVVRRAHLALSSGGLQESTLLLLLEVLVNLGRAASPAQAPALERLPPLIVDGLRSHLEAGATALVLAELEALAVLPELPWQFVELMATVLGYRHDPTLAVQTQACGCYEAFFQSNPGLRVRAQLAELRPPCLPSLAACLQPPRLAQQLGHRAAAGLPDWSTRLAPAACACLASILVPLSALRVDDSPVYPSPTGRGEHGDTEAREEASLGYGLVATVAEALASQESAVQALCAIIASHRGPSSREEVVVTQGLTVLLKTAGSIASTAPGLVRDGKLWELTLQLILAEGPPGNATTAATLLLRELLSTVPTADGKSALPLPAAAFGVGALLQRLASGGEDVVVLSATAGLLAQLLSHGVNSAAISQATLRQPDTLASLQRVLSATAEEVGLQNWVGGPLGGSELLLLGARAGVADGPAALMLRCAQLGAGEGGGARAAAEPLNGLMESGCWESVCACLNDLAQGRERCPFSIIGSRDSLQLVYEVFSRDGGRYLPMLVQHNLLQSFVALLREESVVCLHSWPKELDGGSDALCLLVDLVSQSVFLPFSPPGPVDEELLQLVQRVLAGPAEVVAKVVGVLRLMANSGKHSAPLASDAYELPARLISRLVLGHELFGRQFVEAGGLRDGVLPRLLDGGNPPALLIDALLLVSQLARSNKDYYAHVDGAEIYGQIKTLLAHEEAAVRAKACNLLGNLCRHSAYCYPALLREQLLPRLLTRLSDPVRPPHSTPMIRPVAADTNALVAGQEHAQVRVLRGGQRQLPQRLGTRMQHPFGS